MTNDELMALCQRGLDHAKAHGADEAEVAAHYVDGTRIDFEKNDLAIALADDETSFGVKVIHEGRLGFASSNDPDSLDACIEDAIEIAKTLEKDPGAGIPEARPLEPVAGLNDPSLAELGVKDVTEAGARLLASVRETDSRLSIDGGGVATSRGRRCVANSKGVLATEESGYIGGHLFGMAVDGDAVGSFCVDGGASRRREDLESILTAAVTGFADKALGALHPGAGESYRGPVLFTPEATSSLLVSNLIGMISAPTVRKGKSPLAEKLGEEFASPSFQLMDDGLLAGSVGSSTFDREGMPRQRLNLVEDGVLKTFLFDDREARLAARDTGSTGHAAGSSTTLPGVGPGRLVLKPGTQALADIERDAGRCVIVTRFSGSTNGVTGEFSGVVKAGFLSENGVRRPIAETLISGNLLEAWRSIAAISKESHTLMGGDEMPWVLVDGLSVTAG